MSKVLSQLNAVDTSMTLAEYCFSNGNLEASTFIMKLTNLGSEGVTPQTSVAEFIEFLGDGKRFVGILSEPVLKAPITTLEKIKMSLVLLIGFLIVFGGGGIVLLMYIRGEVDNELVRDWFGLLMELIKIFGSSSITDVV